MSKGLEALEKIEDTLIGIASSFGINGKRAGNSINQVRVDYRIDLIEKSLKALEIIKKLLIIDDDKQRIDVRNCIEMSDDEYELLKEVLE